MLVDRDFSFADSEAAIVWDSPFTGFSINILPDEYSRPKRNGLLRCEFCPFARSIVPISLHPPPERGLQTLSAQHQPLPRRIASLRPVAGSATLYQRRRNSESLDALQAANNSRGTVHGVKLRCLGGSVTRPYSVRPSAGHRDRTTPWQRLKVPRTGLSLFTAQHRAGPDGLDVSTPKQQSIPRC